MVIWPVWLLDKLTITITIIIIIMLDAQEVLSKRRAAKRAAAIEREWGSGQADACQIPTEGFATQTRCAGEQVDGGQVVALHKTVRKHP